MPIYSIWFIHIAWYLVHTTINLNLTYMPDWMKSMRVLARARFQFNGASKQQKHWMNGYSSVPYGRYSQIRYVPNHQMKITYLSCLLSGGDSRQCNQIQ